MATFHDEITAEIATMKAKIAVLETHLATGLPWLQVECGKLWGDLKHIFSSTPSQAAAPTSTPPAV